MAALHGISGPHEFSVSFFSPLLHLEQQSVRYGIALHHIEQLVRARYQTLGAEIENVSARWSQCRIKAEIIIRIEEMR